MTTQTPTPTNEQVEAATKAILLASGTASDDIKTLLASLPWREYTRAALASQPTSSDAAPPSGEADDDLVAELAVEIGEARSKPSGDDYLDVTMTAEEWRVILTRLRASSPAPDGAAGELADGLRLLAYDYRFDLSERAKAFLERCATALRTQPSRDDFNAASMWRNGVTNTAALIDYIHRAHPIDKRNKAFAAFDAALSEAIQQWFDTTRAAKPTSYEESEAVWQRFRPTLPTPPQDTTQ